MASRTERAFHNPVAVDEHAQHIYPSRTPHKPGGHADLRRDQAPYNVRLGPRATAHGLVRKNQAMWLRQNPLGVLLAASALSLFACSQERVCTLVGFQSMVRVEVPPSAELSEFCLVEDCIDGDSYAAIVLDSDEPATYSYRVVVTLGDDQEHVITGEVTAEEYFANGRGCEPRTSNATLMVREDGFVDITHP